MHYNGQIAWRAEWVVEFGGTTNALQHAAMLLGILKELAFPADGKGL